MILGRRLARPSDVEGGETAESRKRLVVLASGSGTNLQALLDAEGLDGEVVAVVSDRADARALDRARAKGVAATAVILGADRNAWEDELTREVARHDPDLVILAGFMRILSGSFVDRWPVINVHPSLLPAFPGARAIEDALAWGVKLVGVTVHFVDEQVDHGPIIAQEAIAVRADDTAASLHARVQSVEHRLLPDVIRAFCVGQLKIEGRHVRITP